MYLQKSLNASYSLIDINGFIPSVRDIIIWAIIFTVFVEITIRLTKTIWPIFSGIYELLRDWKGVEEKENRPKIPGVMERLDKIENSQNDFTNRLDRIEKLLTKDKNDEQDSKGN